jgi:hypothetical protein
MRSKRNKSRHTNRKAKEMGTQKKRNENQGNREWGMLPKKSKEKDKTLKQEQRVEDGTRQCKERSGGL